MPTKKKTAPKPGPAKAPDPITKMMAEASGALAGALDLGVSHFSVCPLDENDQPRALALIVGNAARAVDVRNALATLEKKWAKNEALYG